MDAAALRPRVRRGLRRAWSQALDDYRARPRWFDAARRAAPGPGRRTSRWSSGSTSRSASTRAASACSRATTARRRATSACRWWAWACSTARATSARRSTPTASSSTSTPTTTSRACPCCPCRRPAGGVLTVPVDLPGRVVQAAVWKAQVGRVPVLMLDTDIPLNDPADRPITGMLYVRGREMRLCQEIVLGRRRRARAARARHPPRVWHMNEGHVAFLALERARERVQRGRQPGRGARRRWRATPSSPPTRRCPAGNETFDRDLVRRYLEPWIAATWAASPTRRSRLGRGQRRLQPDRARDPALLGDQRREQAPRRRSPRRMWRHLFPDGPEAPDRRDHERRAHRELDRAGDARASTPQHLDADWEAAPARARELWSEVRTSPTPALWAAHRSQKERLVRFVRERVRAQSARHGLRARRAARRSRACSTRTPSPSASRGASPPTSARSCSFRPRPRCARLLGDRARPVQSSSPARRTPPTAPGQEVVRRLVRCSRTASSRGRLVFLEDYDIEVGRACWCRAATSGSTRRAGRRRPAAPAARRSPINGGINLSMLDGWWAEGYRGDNGWAIGDGDVSPDDRRQQDREDAGRSTERSRARWCRSSSSATRRACRAGGSRP